MNILLVAEESAGVQTLRALLETEQHVSAVLTGERSRFAPSVVAKFATAHGVSVLRAERVLQSSMADWIRARSIDLLLNVHSLHVIDRKVLNAPRIGCFNLHPGPLPGYAGLNVPSWAIYHGETHHAVTLHWMEAGVDTGAIAYSSSFDIGADETALGLWGKCVRIGVPLVLRLVETGAADPSGIPAIPQNAARRRYFGRVVPNEGRIDWCRPGRELVNFVRACDYFPFTSPWGHPRAGWQNRRIEVLRASRTGEPSRAPSGMVGGTDGGSALVAASDEWISLHRLRVAGHTIDAADLLVPGSRVENGR